MSNLERRQNLITAGVWGTAIVVLITTGPLAGLGALLVGAIGAELVHRVTMGRALFGQGGDDDAQG